MSITSTIRTMLGMAVPDTADAFQSPAPALPRDLEAQQHQALMDAAREDLRTAHVDRAAAQRALSEAEGRVRRALEVIQTSQRLDAEAGQAEAAAREAAKVWAASGCPEDGRPSPDLLDKAAAASNAAIDARTVAAGAMDALPGLRRAAADARIVLEHADEAVRTAAVGVLAAAAEPRLAELERLRESFEAALRPLAALRHLLRPSGPNAALSGFASSSIGVPLERRLKEAMPLQPNEGDLHGSAADLRERALRLLEDPQAHIEL